MCLMLACHVDDEAAVGECTARSMIFARGSVTTFEVDAKILQCAPLPELALGGGCIPDIL